MTQTRTPSRHSPSGLLVDLYQLTMGQSYVTEGLAEAEATFSLFFRTLPKGWGYALSAGLDDALGYLEGLTFTDDDLTQLEGTGLFEERFLERLRGFRFGGSVRALPEGTVFFPDEPALEVTGPIVEAQIAETMVLNEVHLQTLIASKAARCVDAAQGRTLADFALRRTHGGEAGLKVARASYVAGFDATSNVLAGQVFGIPVTGTMAHSYVESFRDELSAFRAFARAYPDESVLLVDTYDTLAGTRHAAAVGQELAGRGHHLRGIRLDSGDVAELSKGARAILDDAGLEDTIVFASGSLDEVEIARLLDAGAPIDGFGVGSKLGVAADSPFLDMAYKLVELEGRPVLKLSELKATLPGRKQIWRRSGFDVLALESEPPDSAGESLLREVMRDGRVLHAEPLETIRERARTGRESLAERHRRLDAEPYEVTLDPSLESLRAHLAARAVL